MPCDLNKDFNKILIFLILEDTFRSFLFFYWVFNLFVLERNEHNVDFPFVIPIFVELPLTVVKFQIWNFESNSNIRFSSNQEELKVSVWCFDFLLIRRHDSVFWTCVWFNLRILHFKKNLFLACL